jgi:protein TonB
MLVVINADGTLVDARLLTSSGVPALDAAALRIVRLSAPFPAFPVELRRRFDQLEILRSWQFTRRGARIEH